MPVRQLIVGPLTYLPAALKHYDLIGPLHRAQPVSNHQYGMIAFQLINRFHYISLRLLVKRTCGLVKHEYGRVMIKRTGNPNPLSLSTGKLYTALTDDRLPLLRQI